MFVYNINYMEFKIIIRICIEKGLKEFDKNRRTISFEMLTQKFMLKFDPENDFMNSIISQLKNNFYHS